MSCTCKCGRPKDCDEEVCGICLCDECSKGDDCLIYSGDYDSQE
jgi:hypothetical protein